MQMHARTFAMCLHRENRSSGWPKPAKIDFYWIKGNGFTEGSLFEIFRSISCFEVSRKYAKLNFQNCCKTMNGAIKTSEGTIWHWLVFCSEKCSKASTIGALGRAIREIRLTQATAANGFNVWISDLRVQMHRLHLKFLVRYFDHSWTWILDILFLAILRVFRIGNSK